MASLDCSNLAAFREVQLNWRGTTASELEDFLPQQSLYWHLLADFQSFFWRLATLTHFMGIATLYVATLTRSNYEISNFVPVPYHF